MPGMAIQILEFKIRGERSFFQLGDGTAWHTEEEGSEQE